MRDMKDSGVQWIGEIPKHWVKTKIKNGCDILSSGTTPASGNGEYYINGTINWIQSGDLYSNPIISSVSKRITQKAFDNTSSLKVYIAPFIVVAMYGASVGNVSISEIDACCNQACCCIKNNEKLDLYFLMYWLVSCKNDFLAKASGGGQPNISQQIIQNEVILLPSKEEQYRIASFLDSKCAEIDALSADIQKEIETLQEYHKSVITKAVTKGLDPNVDMKDSGIEWIGEIPVHWNLVPFYRLVDQVSDSIVDGPFGSDMKNEEYVDEGVPVIQLGAIKENSMDFSKMHFITDSKADILRRHNAFPFNLAIAKMMPAGKCCEIPDKFERYVVSADVIRASVSNTVLRHFLNYAFNTYIKVWANAETSGSTRARINIEKLKKFKFALPDQNEMEFILNKLDSECTEIDSIIADKQKQLETLAEYRKSLIYEYVTGKKEVPTA